MPNGGCFRRILTILKTIRIELKFESTQGVPKGGCLKPPDPVLFKVNQSTIFMLVALHDETKNILLCGSLEHPALH